MKKLLDYIAFTVVTIFAIFCLGFIPFVIFEVCGWPSIFVIILLLVIVWALYRTENYLESKG